MPYLHPYRDLISHSYLAEVAAIGLQRIKNAANTTFRLGESGGKGETSTPHFLITDKSTGKSLPFNGISMNPWTTPLRGIDTFADEHLSPHHTVQELLGCKG